MTTTANQAQALAEARRLLHQRPPRTARQHALLLARAEQLINLARAYQQTTTGPEPPVCDSACRATEDQLRQQIANLRAALHTTRAERDQLRTELAELRQHAHPKPTMINGERR